MTYFRCQTSTQILYKYILCVLWKMSTVCVPQYVWGEVLGGLSQKKRRCAEAHKRVSLSGLQSKASINCSQCMELLSSFLSVSSSALPLVSRFFSSFLICLLSRTNPKIQRKKETVLKPKVRPKYTILYKQKKQVNKQQVNEKQYSWEYKLLYSV